ncbi:MULTISPECIES: LysR substrate-binding domain-containing protein [unclassified Mesorhizobium]|uniref:LysR substrate-binding domain-containing protein n=1 Tax=unclassified Mesorhizobium TaxID=325217 RepID=UPI000FCB8F8D|nr:MULTISPECIES: LysR substrate-binding domain-containing protein [unclassified Mesorhizobium]RUV99656.1 LysR family transcriptional regulator [Mesorhizobium sp. M1A.F.Ca.IN.020.04.1.1]RUW06869.1 LysR family transcriptional regulator [Mesorhizobium sp. M1A.F.Ca.IN.020.03.1.1]RWF74055.1 MAG: LysR family transcriptional regulator [Mesorhizobium sp.]RWG13629.1 MAG: LysR family transcriptional regulator [Mesorhizobium sp.]RWG29789.1 MAG: LysR family transcriptional regulator [Mesorhizobium sp.]
MTILNRVHLNGLRAVETVARVGSLAAAAAELNVSVSAVSQQIKRTEKQLGQALFERTSGGLVTTEFGIVFTARLSAGFRELAQAVALADEATECTLVVSVAPAFASKWLLPRLSRHFARLPNVLLRIDASGRLADLDHSDIDIAIRMGDGAWPGVNAELLLAQEVFPVCVPAIAAKLNSIEDLARTCAITDERAMISWDSWFKAAGVEPVTFQKGARFTDPMLCLESAIAGHGVMLAWQLLTADALADGRLVAPFGVRAESGLGYWMVTSATKSESRKVRDFKAWVREEIEATKAQFRALDSAA